ncbi:MAG: tetratricopeptide repeat protein [Gammaproteobacteria bacterium]|nr:tetratricopeptide repeat protein [Gammaproteobacteria bacterium]MYF39001.1 tetratricopeptide repeat protein [Gammaproteobacteria bacterium]
MTVRSRTPAKNKEKSFDIHAIERICGLTERQIHSVARRGLISPLTTVRDASDCLTFQDILILRKIGQLISKYCSLSSVLSQLGDIVAIQKSDQPLSALSVTTIGPYLVVRIDGVYQHVTSRQTFFNFDVDNDREHSNVLQFPFKSDTPPTHSLTATLSDAELERILDSDELTSDDWFNLGIQFESLNEIVRARSAYRNAIGLDEDNIDAYINLGRLLQLDDKFRDAKKLYEKVLQLRPENELANYNLGTLFDMLDEFDLAVRYYLRAPNMAMAHHNLARIYDHLGNDVKAARHLSIKHDLEHE